MSRKQQAAGSRPQELHFLTASMQPVARSPQPAARSRGRVFGAAVVLLSAALFAACRQDMHDAPRYDPYEDSLVFPKGSSAQPLVAGTVPRGFLHEDQALYTGKVNDELVDAFPFAITRADLDRGEVRFDTFCAPCHGRTGEGNGLVVQRGYRQPPTYHQDRLRQVPVGYLFNVITNGFGQMPDYRAQVTPEDRWRVIAYIRALQLSQQAPASAIPADEMQRLQGGGPPAAQPAREGQ
jgi:mono/diheme cytochrome c family protein